MFDQDVGGNAASTAKSPGLVYGALNKESPHALIIVKIVELGIAVLIPKKTKTNKY